MVAVEQQVERAVAPVSSDRASGWHTHVFNVLAGPICRWAGAMLYRRLA